MAALPIELIAEILSRLPVKSLLRFKCVCKPWNSLIKSPNFIKLHLNQALISNSGRHLLLCLHNGFLHSAEIEGINPNHVAFSKPHHPLSLRKVELFGSCNGVICIGENQSTRPYHITGIFLFNPLTKSKFKLPGNPNSHHHPDPDYYQARAFGFGYDSKSDDYKVLKLVNWSTKDIKHRLPVVDSNARFYVEAELYSLKNNSWKSVQGIFAFLNNNSWKSVQGIYAFFNHDKGHCVLVNEALHCTVSKSGDIIASFDLQTESFSFIDCPKLVHSRGVFPTMDLAELGGCLCAFVNYDNDVGYFKCDVWVMKEYGNKESWVTLFSIDHEFIGSEFQIKPFVYSKDGKRILLQIEIVGNEFGWYDLESKKFDAIPPHEFPNESFEAGSFVGSLVSIEDNEIEMLFVNEALHYMVLSKKSENIASFDLQTESFSFIDYPELIYNNTKDYVTMHLTELGGCLCAFVNYNTGDVKAFLKCDLWVMKEYRHKESWVRLFSIGNEFTRIDRQIKPIVYSKDGNRILLEIDNMKFSWYDLESNNFDEYTPHGLPNGPLEMRCLVGSLVSFEHKLQCKTETLPII